MVSGLLNLLPFQFPLTLSWVFHIHSFFLKRDLLGSPVCFFVFVVFFPMWFCVWLSSHTPHGSLNSICSLHRIHRRNRGTLGTLRGGSRQRRWWPQNLGFQGDLGMTVKETRDFLPKKQGRVLFVVMIGTPLKTIMTGWKISILNRKYIFKWWIFHCHVSFGGVL